MTPLRIVFMGTADLAVASLAALVRDPGCQVVGVVSQPDKPKGRDLRLQPTPVKALAQREALPVLQPARARDPAFLQELSTLQPELVVVAAYGQILPPALLGLPRHGCLNVHTSLLPKYRGAAPIQWALLNGERETGVTLMKMDAGLDTGDMLVQARTVIRDEDDAQTLHDRLAGLGADLLVRTIPDYVAGRVSPQPQPTEGVSYARKITKEDGRLDWTQPARVLWNRVRGLTPWPGTYARLATPAGPQLLKFWQASVRADARGVPGTVLQADKHGVVVACGEGALCLLVLQREGGRRLTAREFLAGHPLLAGDRFET
jgi:methionyl-tRNA formyltransferase